MNPFDNWPVHESKDGHRNIEFYETAGPEGPELEG
jgi:hypothetical protein